MANITNDTIKHLSVLTNIKLTPDEETKYLKDLQPVLTHMDDISKLDTNNIPETARVTDETNVLREDQVGDSLTVAEATANAKKTHAGYIVVERVIDNE